MEDVKTKTTIKLLITKCLSGGKKTAGDCKQAFIEKELSGQNKDKYEQIIRNFLMLSAWC